MSTEGRREGVKTVHLGGDPLNYLTLEQLEQAITGRVIFLNNDGREVVRQLSTTDMRKYERAVQCGYLIHTRWDDPVTNAYWQHCYATGRPHIRAKLGRKYAGVHLEMVSWGLTAAGIEEASTLLLELSGRDGEICEASSSWCESDSVKVEEAEQAARRLFEIAMRSKPVLWRTTRREAARSEH
jgi:hypothetical protein